MSSGNLLKFVYQSLVNHNDLDGYKVDVECTHHGPNVSKPLLFLEIGSTKEEWENCDAVEVIKKVILDINGRADTHLEKSAIVLGGDHYMTEVKYLFEKGVPVSHMCPSNMVHSLDQEILQEAISNSYEKVMFVIDLAHVGQHLNRIMDLVNSLEVEYRFLHEFKLSP